MKIEILGTGCQKCRQLEANARKALEESDKEAEVVKVTDITEIIARNVLATPALVLDGEVKCSGTIPDVEEIKTWL